MARKSFEPIRRLRRNFWLAFVMLPAIYMLAISNAHLAKNYMLIGGILLAGWLYLSVRTCLAVCPACGDRFFSGAAYFSGRCAGCGKSCSDN